MGYIVKRFNLFYAYPFRKKLKGEYDTYICVDDGSHYFFPVELYPSIIIWLIDTPYSPRLDSIMAKVHRKKERFMMFPA